MTNLERSLRDVLDARNLNGSAPELKMVRETELTSLRALLDDMTRCLAGMENATPYIGKIPNLKKMDPIVVSIQSAVKAFAFDSLLQLDKLLPPLPPFWPYKNAQEHSANLALTQTAAWKWISLVDWNRFHDMYSTMFHYRTGNEIVINVIRRLCYLSELGTISESVWRDCVVSLLNYESSSIWREASDMTEKAASLRTEVDNALAVSSISDILDSIRDAASKLRRLNNSVRMILDLRRHIRHKAAKAMDDVGFIISYIRDGDLALPQWPRERILGMTSGRREKLAAVIQLCQVNNEKWMWLTPGVLKGVIAQCEVQATLKIPKDRIPDRGLGGTIQALRAAQNKIPISEAKQLFRDLVKDFRKHRATYLADCAEEMGGLEEKLDSVIENMPDIEKDNAGGLTPANLPLDSGLRKAELEISATLNGEKESDWTSAPLSRLLAHLNRAALFRRPDYTKLQILEAKARAPVSAVEVAIPTGWRTYIKHPELTRWGIISVSFEAVGRGQVYALVWWFEKGDMFLTSFDVDLVASESLDFKKASSAFLGLLFALRRDLVHHRIAVPGMGHGDPDTNWRKRARVRRSPDRPKWMVSLPHANRGPGKGNGAGGTRRSAIIRRGHFRFLRRGHASDDAIQQSIFETGRPPKPGFTFVRTSYVGGSGYGAGFADRRQIDFAIRKGSLAREWLNAMSGSEVN